jgi:hypothetical protein
MEIRSLVSHVFEGLRDLEELLNAGVWDRVRESAFRWLLYSISQGVLDALAALIAELGFRKPLFLVSRLRVTLMLVTSLGKTVS